VIITVYVPVGKQIKVNRNIAWGSNVHLSGPWNDGEWYDEEDGLYWKDSKDYIMKADGLYTLDGKPADESKWKKEKDENDDEGDDSDSNKINKKADSIKKSIENSKKELEKIEAKKQTAMVEKNGSSIITSYQVPLMIHL
jgi:hypothetical protein